jgi:holo-[acyl-carrier protein] synthase
LPVGVGVDLCGVQRLTDILARTPALMTRLFTPVERTLLIGAGADTGAVAAQMFAGKEAVMKSLGAGLDTVPFDSIEVDPAGRSVLLYGAASERAEELGAGSFDVRIDFVDGPDGPVALAEVVALGR